ncbi:MAG: HEAT repeat domain-containing protein [Parachlamydiaceae bacterium]|nr:HEAT repeat domain-containing protein [Parachlamydiaceae bacterium]
MKSSFFILILTSLTCFSFLGFSENSTFKKESGHLLFLVQQGEHEKALKLYQTFFQSEGKHDFELLHQIGLGIIINGAKQNDPESQLLSLFGASVSANEEVYSILEESLNSKYPQIQLVALASLAQFQDSRADKALLNAIRSRNPLIRFEAAHFLCKKKHPMAVSQTESLMYKMPSSLWPFFVPLFAMLDDPHSTRILVKLLNHPSKNIRLAAAICAAQYQRDDLVPYLRKILAQQDIAIQEAVAFSLGKLKDELSIEKLNILAASSYPTVSLAAHYALYQLGQDHSVDSIEQGVKKGDLYAIYLMGKIPNRSESLLELSTHTDRQVRLNVMIALLKQHHPKGAELAEEFIVKDQNDWGFTSLKSPGKSMTVWKVTPSANQIFKEDLSAYMEHLKFKEKILNKLKETSESQLIRIAHLIFAKQQNDLIAMTVEILQNLETAEAIDCLKEHQQQLGAPLVRHYCNLALFCLQEPGPYQERLQEWVKKQSQTEFIRFKDFDLWKMGEDSYSLTPEETSKLLIQSCQALAQRQDAAGVETLVEIMAEGHSKNRFALAGLLIRASQ